MNPLIQAIDSTPSLTLTENGAVTFDSTTSKVLDLFSRGAALRTRSDSEVSSLFAEAYLENRVLALKCLFYIRDIRGGQGERKVFRICLKWLAENDFPTVYNNFENIGNYGRYDDILCLLDGSHEFEVAEFIKKVLAADIAAVSVGRPISLLAKWLPSVNTSSPETRRLAKKLIRHIGCSDKEYRKTLSQLRAAINIVESKMCAKDWDSIDFSKVPSRATMLYKKAFRRHNEDRYDSWLESVEKGEAKINSSTLFPYDLVREAMNLSGYNADEASQSAIKTLDLQWKNLPNYLEKNPHNGLVVADVSGSMNGLPIQVSISLAMYFAERNVGAFKDYFITFSGKPTLQKVVGNNIVEKVTNLNDAEWEMNTNIQAVFDLILNAAKRENVPAKDMPSVIYIISDMEFDDCCEGSRTNFEAIERKYAESGYTRPNICFWNVDSRNDQSPVTKSQNGTMLVSGCSPSIFKSVTEGANVTPYDFMLEVLNAERYNKVVVA